MELTYDWRGFQSVFFPQRRYAISQAGEPTHPIHAVVEGGTVVAVFSESEDLSEWLGANVQDMAHELSTREIVLFEREQVDALVQQSVGQPHFYDQLEFLAAQAEPQLVTGGAGSGARAQIKPAQPEALERLFFKRHFLLEAIRGWWAKVLPSAYGIFIRIEGHSEQDLLVLIRRGRIDSFQEPELASLGADRRRQTAEVVKYLSEKHLVPVQGLLVPAQEWRQWGESADPWKKIALAVRANRVKLVPFRWGLATLLASRGFLSV